jgi:hypothetical protein
MNVKNVENITKKNVWLDAGVLHFFFLLSYHLQQTYSHSNIEPLFSMSTHETNR